MISVKRLEFEQYKNRNISFIRWTLGGEKNTSFTDVFVDIRTFTLSKLQEYHPRWMTGISYMTVRREINISENGNTLINLRWKCWEFQLQCKYIRTFQFLQKMYVKKNISSICIETLLMDDFKHLLPAEKKINVSQVISSQHEKKLHYFRKRRHIDSVKTSLFSLFSSSFTKFFI